MVVKKLIYVVAITNLIAEDGYARGVVHVHGYTRSNGTYVAPHIRTPPDSSVENNFSYKAGRGANYNIQQEYQLDPNTDWSGFKLIPKEDKPTSQPITDQPIQKQEFATYQPVNNELEKPLDTQGTQQKIKKKYNLNPNLNLRYCLKIKNAAEFDRCINP